MNIIQILNGKEVSLIDGKGFWPRYLAFKDRLYWCIQNRLEEVIEDSPALCLPSAAGARTEIELVAMKRFEEADRALSFVESEEEKDAENRKKGAKRLF